MRLAVRARTADPDPAAFEAALRDGRLVVSWLCRGTLHLVAAEHYGWLHALTTPPLHTGCMRRLGQEGVAPAAAERAVAEIERALADSGPLTRAQLGDRVAALGVRTEGQALVHILFLASLRGVAVRGPMVGKQHAYALVRDWLGDRVATASHTFDREPALAELARRYLRGHGPATDRDLARWAGLPLRDARAGLEAVASELAERADGLLSLRDAPAVAPLPPPRLLGPWDPLLVGWKDRGFIVGEHEPKLISGGLFRPFVLAEGRAVATWGIRDGRLELHEPFVALPARTRAAFVADAREAAAYLGLELALGGSERA